MTADLRREEIAQRHHEMRGQASGAPKGKCWSCGASWPCDVAVLLADHVRSQDTATARIAALTDIVKSLVKRANGHTPQWVGDHRTYALHIEERFIEKARVVLSGETRTGGEPEKEKS